MTHTQGTDTDTGLRMDVMPIDRLRALAAEGRDAKTRAEAKRELEARLAAVEAAPVPALSARVSASEFGTPRPEIVVAMPRGTAYRELRAKLHEVAAEVERQLAPTREGWVVELRRVDEYVGAVHLELMDGTAREVDRAKVVLSAVLGSAVSPNVLPPGPRRRDLKAERERRKAREAAEAAGSDAPAQDPAGPDVKQTPLFSTSSPAPTAANDAAPPTAAPAPVAPPSPVAPAAELSDRDAKRAYRQLAGAAAATFEARLLGYGRDHLPAHAVAVLDGGRRTAEYWMWLRAEYESTQRGAVEV